MDLSESQQEALLNFQAMTECYDLPEALHYLQSNTWDPTVSPTQLAASAFLAQTHESAGTALIDTDPWDEGEVYQPDPVVAIYHNVTSRIQSFWNRIGNAHIVPGAIRGDPASQQSRITSLLRKRLPEATVLPNFQTAALEQYEQLAKLSRKPLLIWFYSSQTSQSYLTDTLCCEVIVDILNKNFLLWGLDAKSSQFTPLKRTLGLQTLPAFVAGRKAAERQIEYIESLVGETTLEELAAYLGTVLLKFEEFERPRDSRLEEARRIRAEQDQALREAEFEAQQREKSAKSQLVAQEKALQEALEKQRQEAQLREDLKTELGPEPPDSADACTVVLRLPSGEKLQRRFLRSDQVKVRFI